jgi:tetratricopeptide (TPR) repeat protein
MRANIDPRLQQLLGEMVRARELTEQEQYEEARQMLLRLRTECVRAGIRSAHLCWGLAIVSDGLGELETAVTYIREALELDPLAIPYQRSFNVIVDRIRRSLGDELRMPDDPAIPRLYELLIQLGEGDVSSHLAMSRYLHHTGDHAGAMRLLEALTTLAPSSRPAWLQKAVVARALGDYTKASLCEIEAAALEAQEPVPFSGVRQARG